MKSKSVIALIMTVIMTVSMLVVPFSFPASAVGGVQAKLDEVMKEFPPVKTQGDKNTVYFTVSGKPSKSSNSDDCFYPAVARAHGYNWDNMWSAYSCCGFVHFVFRYIFGVEFTWQESVTSKVLTLDKSKGESGRIKQLDSFFKTCKVGDAILFRRPSTHYVIFLGYDEKAQRVSTYDCSWDYECAVKTLNRSLSGMKDYDSITLYHAKNYDTINTKYGVEPIIEYNVISSSSKTIEVTGCSENVSNLTIPEKIDGYTVVSIADRAFANTSLEGVGLPDTLTSIGENAFANTPLIKNLLINNAVYIGDYLIYAGGSDKEFTVRYSTKLIADGAFQSYSIQTVIISQETKYISDTAFDRSSVNTIKGNIGSRAEEYAKSKGYSFVPLSATEYDKAFSQSLGDVNGDEKISIIDAKYVLQYAAKLKSLNKVQFASADVNKDGKVSIIDAKWILQQTIGIKKF